jgi:para-aminobenzoate synthetase component 1
MSYPWVEPFDAALALQHEPGLVLLESSAAAAAVGDRSLLAVRPLRVETGGLDGVDPADGLLKAGWLSYDLGRDLERIPELAADDRRLPAMALGHYGAWIEFDRAARELRLHGRGEAKAILQAGLENAGPAGPARHVPPAEWRSSLPRPDYEQAVRDALDYIRAGDVFQVNLSQRLSAAWQGDVIALYARVREHAPAPFMGLVRLADADVISASPELFLRRRGHRIETRPIKGTRPRGRNERDDTALAEQLLTSEKDRAENVMIVDLSRNDLGRVCEYGSVQVEQLCAIESYASVHHLGSTISGRLRDGIDVRDVLRASFPPGSVTGAPKIRAMEIIEELEPVRRSVYCGSLAWIGPDGDFDLSVAIRTLTASAGRLDLHAGGAVVADSDPHGEWRESMHKLAGLLVAAGGRLADEPTVEAPVGARSAT